MSWNTRAKKSVVDKTMAALKSNGINCYFARDEAEAIKKVFEIIPKGSEVMNMSSVTLDSLGISKIILESKKYNAVKNKLSSMDRKKQGKEMQMLGAAPDYSIGSVHAVTQDGKIAIASASGSQLPAYAFSSNHVIWVVGTQKIVKDIEEAYKRIYEHCFPLENERAKKVYGMGSVVGKILTINYEGSPNRLNLIFVNKILGF